MAANPITAIHNNTFGGILDKLDHLDISSLHLNILEVIWFFFFCFSIVEIFSLWIFVKISYCFQDGALGKSTSLRSLQLSTYSGLPDFNIPNIVSNLSNLQKLQISSPEPQKVISGPKITYKNVAATDLRKEMAGQLPLKLREITISGKGFKSISETIFQVFELHYYCSILLLLLWYITLIAYQR